MGFRAAVWPAIRRAGRAGGRAGSRSALCAKSLKNLHESLYFIDLRYPKIGKCFLKTCMKINILMFFIENH